MYPRLQTVGWYNIFATEVDANAGKHFLSIVVEERVEARSIKPDSRSEKTSVNQSYSLTWYDGMHSAYSLFIPGQSGESTVIEARRYRPVLLFLSCGH